MFGSDGSEGQASIVGPAVAGSWYPSDASALSDQVDRLLAIDSAEDAPEDTAPGGRVLAVIAPHAGYMYSGAVAARGFRSLLRRRFDRVLLLGPSHYASFVGAALPAAASYRTPLGDVALDDTVVKDLGGRPGWRTDDAPFLREHSLEAEIPFLQRVLSPGWKLVPALIGYGSGPADLDLLSGVLGPLLDARTLVVVSSDLTHYGESFRYVPFREDIPAKLEELDMGAVARMLACDGDGFRSYVERTGATICGRRAIDLLLRVLPAGCTAELAAYDTSGRMTGSWDHCVSYGSIVYREPGP